MASARYELLESEDEDQHDFRMVLVGKTGSGKSSAGNTILGRRAFESTTSSSAVTQTCKKKRGEFEGQTLVVVDTPGLFDPQKSKEVLEEEIVKSISLMAPGPHVFLVVIQLNTFTKEERETVETLWNTFRDKAPDFSMVLFTHGDNLEADGVTIESFISGSSTLLEFIRRCGGGYHVFNNRTKDPSQVRELLEKIKQMVQRNGGRFYTNEFLQEVEEAIREEEERLLRENPDMSAEEARKQAEKSNKFIKGVLAVLGAGAGAVVGIGIEAAVGATVGMIGGPVGAVVGATLGLAVGAAIALYLKKKKTSNNEISN